MARPAASVDGKGAWVLSQLYYYAAAVAGVGLVLGGTISSLMGIRVLVLPSEFEQAREGVRGILLGMCFALPGAALVWWHLREARRREGGPFTTAFWGTSLYFHLVSLVALVFVLVGTIGMLTSAVNAALPSCPQGEIVPVGPPPAPEGASGVEPPEGVIAEPAPGGSITYAGCYPSGGEAGRQALNFAIVLIVGGPVFWWHLRQGRRLTGPDEPGAVARVTS